MGDSSGGNIALILGLFYASEFLQERERSAEGPCPVESIFAICPATDLRNTNPEMALKATGCIGRSKCTAFLWFGDIILLRELRVKTG